MHRNHSTPSLLPLLLILLCIGFSAFSQSKAYRAKVVDQSTDRPLAFVNIVFDGKDSRRGTATDIDGNFSIPSSLAIDSIHLSYLGYRSVSLSRSAIPSNGIIKMRPSEYQLKEVEIVAGENPAHRIILNAIANRKINDPEKATEFSYESYNKLIFTSELDSSLINKPEKIAQLDSSQQKFLDFINSQHIFMMESVSKRNFIPPDNSNEKVIASRVSGFKNPAFTLIGTQMQSFSIYNTYFSLLDVDYLSPLAKGSISKYLFVIEDTLYRGQDSVFVISFRPRKGKNFDGMKGVISINTNLYAVQNVIAEPMEIDTEDGVAVKVLQKYEFIEGKQWFPVQLNTNLKFYNASLSIDSTEQPMVGIGTSYLRDIKLKSELDKRAIGNTVLEMEADAGKKRADFWNTYRPDTLSAKEEKTYHFMDSIGEEAKLDEKLKFATAIMTGEWPIGPVNLMLNRIASFNGYEGLRLGMGLRTNDRISKWASVGGYWAYGFKDQQAKFGGDVLFYLNETRDSRLQLLYERDVLERGGLQFFDMRQTDFTSEIYRDFYMNRMDRTEKVEARLGFRAMEHFQYTFFSRSERIEITDNYRFSIPANDQVSLTESEFYLFETGVNVRFAFKEKLVEMFGRRFPVGTKYPIVFLQYTRGEDGVLDGDYQYDRFDIQIDNTINWRNFGETSIRLSGGWVEGDAPLTKLYRSRGVFRDGFSVSAANSFETMLPNEFFSDRYANLFFRHSFKSLLFRKGKFRPELVLTTALGWGELDNVDRHQGIAFKTLEEGYLESGVQLNKLLTSGFTGIGVGAFYRYGPNALEKTEDNLALKATLQFTF